MWSFFYNWIVIPVFWFFLQVARLFIPKIRRGIEGRRNLFQILAQNQKKLQYKTRIWFHASSMGEFEQAKPIIAALRKQYRDIHILVSFFSPSGYDHSKNYKLADCITYIPFDTKANAKKFLDLIQPTAAVFVRYDIWPNHLWELTKRNIPTFIANATMRPSSARLYPVARQFHKNVFDKFLSILTVSADDVEAFKRFSLHKPVIQAIGETRYDQVSQRSAEARQKHLLPAHILKDKKVFLAGSTWPEDEEVLIPALKKILQVESQILMILVPHEPTLEALESIESQLNGSLSSIRFSDLNDYKNESVLLVDSIGILMALYQYAQVAYVGGSFRQGVHNVLEPAVYGIPVMYGPKHGNSQEAKELAKRGGGFVVYDQQDCYDTLKTLLTDSEAHAAAGSISLQLVQENLGATERFLKHLLKVL